MQHVAGEVGWAKSLVAILTLKSSEEPFKYFNQKGSIMMCSCDEKKRTETVEAEISVWSLCNSLEIRSKELDYL